MVSERPGLFVGGKPPFLRGQLAGPLEPPDAWVVPGWRWVSAHSEVARLPTFTRAIPRTRPSPAAPGLHKVSSTALSRYYADQLRFPPYTYADELCFVAEGCADPGPGTGVSARVALASERETLIVVPRGTTRMPSEVAPLVIRRGGTQKQCVALSSAIHFTHWRWPASSVRSWLSLGTTLCTHRMLLFRSGSLLSS